MNVVGRPFVGLLFLVPGSTETLRIYVRAEVTADPDLLALLAIKGKPPISLLKVTVNEVVLHCAKALIRARLREPDAQVERSRYPTCGQAPAARIAGANAVRIDAGEEESTRTELH